MPAEADRPIRILALETATAVASVALLEDERTRLLWVLERPQAHAERLVPAIAEALAHAGWAYADLSAVAVSAGPGSYTGLRIGASTAKGLCLACDLALIAVPTLEALAWGVSPLAAHLRASVLALLDARRQNVYAALYEPADSGPLLRWGPELLSVEALPERIPEPVLLVGNGAAKSAPVLRSSGISPISLPDPWMRPSAEWVGQRAFGRFRSGQRADIASFEPLYLRDFVPGSPRDPFA